MEAIRSVEGGDRGGLARLLVDVVADGASVGFLPPLSAAEAERYWAGVLDGSTVLWVARQGGDVVGTVQLQLCGRANGAHRAEIAKLMVHPRAQRQGLGRRLMEAAEERARSEGRSLLVLDTRAGDPSNRLYRALGYTEAGSIPQYARSADGSFDATVIYYKLL
ncbi:GNAT family N-acetyltransferase [Paenibacillus sp.]|uniref:GNAT family N-acetyltransferase n=1 Tax=Paenibacillus sp. TaxID=58172 RepID=UPI002D5D6844|nr:GNAT family N-acetyltransferase [Paenibacillus sp.]HZG85492.1 GNAT family N-acetyltransferase [Paenibacillus sp.]